MRYPFYADDFEIADRTDCRTERRSEPWRRLSGRKAPMLLVVQPWDHPRSPVPMCFTRRAMNTLLETVGCYPPETGAKGFGPKDRMGFDLVEFDEQGSRRAGGAVYSPDTSWGEQRIRHHLDCHEMRLWSGDIHSHPGRIGYPSGKSGHALGDLGYVEAVFEQNEWMEWFFIPILTSTGSGEVYLSPWVCRRDHPLEPMVADVRICEVSEFPARTFNPAWEKAAEKNVQNAPEGHPDDLPVELTEAQDENKPTKTAEAEEPAASQPRDGGRTGPIKPAPRRVREAYAGHSVAPAPSRVDESEAIPVLGGARVWIVVEAKTAQMDTRTEQSGIRTAIGSRLAADSSAAPDDSAVGDTTAPPAGSAAEAGDPEKEVDR